MPCTHTFVSACPSSPALCRQTLDSLATYAANNSNLYAWCWIYDKYLAPHPQAQERQKDGAVGIISWEAASAAARFGDLYFARAFTAREPEWVRREGNRSPGWPERRMMTVPMIALLHENWEFLRCVVRECGCVLGETERLVRLIVTMEGVEDGEFAFLFVTLLLLFGWTSAHLDREEGADAMCRGLPRPGEVAGGAWAKGEAGWRSGYCRSIGETERAGGVSKTMRGGGRTARH